MLDIYYFFSVDYMFHGSEVMGGERLWWTWGMAGRGTVPNASLLIYTSSGGHLGNDTDRDAFNGTNGNSSNYNIWPANEGPLGGDQDLIVSVVTASVLILVILITVLGELISFIQPPQTYIPFILLISTDHKFCDIN